jgi:hypothetical protein
MRNIKPVLVGVALLCLVGCTSNRQPSGNVGTEPEITKTNLEIETRLCEPHCEQIAYSYKADPNSPHPLTLQPAESESLKAALESTPASATGDKLHLHADAIDGKLVFLPDSPKDPGRATHVAGGEISLRNAKAASSEAVRVVPTPAALELMRHRETASNSHQ